MPRAVASSPRSNLRADMYAGALRERKHVTSTVSPLVSASICLVLSEAEKPFLDASSTDTRNLPTSTTAQTENTRPSDRTTAVENLTPAKPLPLRRVTASIFVDAKRVKTVITK